MNIKGKCIGTSHIDGRIDVLLSDGELKSIKIEYAFYLLGTRSYHFYEYIKDEKIEVTGFWFFKKIRLLEKTKLKR